MQMKGAKQSLKPGNKLSFITFSYIFEKMFNKLTGLYLKISFLFGFLLSIATTKAILASSGHIPRLKLALFAIVEGLERRSVETLTSFGEIKSKSTAFLIFILITSFRT